MGDASNMVGWNRSTKETQTSAKGRLWSHSRRAHLEGSGPGKLLNPTRRRVYIDLIRSEMKVSERQIFRVLGQHRSTQQY